MRFARLETFLLIGVLVFAGGFAGCGSSEEEADENGYVEEPGMGDEMGDSMDEESEEMPPAETTFEPEPMLEADHLMGGKLLVKKSSFDPDTQMYEIELKNVTEEPLAVRYRVHFFDQDGQLFGASTEWSSKEVPAQYRLRLEGIGPTYDEEGGRIPSYLAVEAQPQ